MRSLSSLRKSHERSMWAISWPVLTWFIGGAGISSASSMPLTFTAYGKATNGT